MQVNHRAPRLDHRMNALSAVVITKENPSQIGTVSIEISNHKYLVKNKKQKTKHLNSIKIEEVKSCCGYGTNIPLLKFDLKIKAKLYHRIALIYHTREINWNKVKWKMNCL